MTGLQHIIDESRSSDDDLLKLAKTMGVKVDQIVFKQYLNTNKNYSILNMGTPAIGGSHWVAVSNKDKIYFDPLNLPRPRVIPSDYKQFPFRIQNANYGHCGQYSILFLYYLQHNALSAFMKLFDPLPNLI
jgi:hypothetical protein